jgi:hypothetical protein
MSGAAKRMRGARATGMGSALLCATACFEAEGTNFYEEPSALQVTSGASGSTGDAGSSGASSDGGSQGTSAGSAGTGGGAGTSSNAGSGGNGGTGGNAGSGKGGDANTGGFAGAAACDAYGETAAVFDGHCYLFVETHLTWRAAGDDCKERGAHLVTLSSKARTPAEFLAENSFVWELGGMAPLWIAATDGKGPLEPGDGTYYEWTNGEAMTFDNWSASQPNNSAAACQDDRPCACDQSTCYEHCGFQWLTAGKDGAVPGWNDRLCEHELPYVCEWDAP